MFLRRLYIRHFRNIDEADISFEPGINIIYGDNAQGKTALLEAIYFLITGTSFRSSHLTDLIMHGAPSFYLQAHFVKHDTDQTIKVSCSAKERRVVCNSTHYSSLTHLLGLLQGVIILPDDCELIKGSPSVRRQYLDLQLAQSDPLYVHHYTRYHKAMRQRNCLLRQKSLHSIESWESEMAKSAIYLTEQRRKVSTDLEKAVAEIHSTLNQTQGVAYEKMSLSYKTSSPETSGSDPYAHYMSLWQKQRKREMDVSYTLFGPHKDDLSIAINNLSARSFASEGQQRSCAATLRLASWQRLRDFGDGFPFMLVDDFGISLDDARRKNLLHHLTNNCGQVFITSAQRPSQLSSWDLPPSHHLLHVSKGRIGFGTDQMSNFQCSSV